MAFSPSDGQDGTRRRLSGRLRLPLLAAVCGVVGLVAAQSRAQRIGLPDPWPRQIKLPDASLLIYQPQLESWRGNSASFRAAVGASVPGSSEPAYGVVWATARTEVDPIRRAVTLQDIQISRSDFPTLPDQGAGFVAELRQALPTAQRTISLDRMEASLAASASASAAPVAVDNQPPEIIVSYVPAILIPIDGEPVLRPVPGAPYERVDQHLGGDPARAGGGPYYLHAYDGWRRLTLDGAWQRVGQPMPELDSITEQVAAHVPVDLLNGKGALPTIYVRDTPAELIVFEGQPDFQPVGTTGLLWAANTTSDVLFDSGNNQFYILVAGRWFRSNLIAGPWSFVSSKDLPAYFSEIPTGSPAGVVLSTVAGTPQAKEAVIEASIPRTATVPLKGGPTFVATYDGAPQLRPVEGTSLRYVVNSPSPIIEASPDAFYALQSGIWFVAPSLDGPWRVATSVPDEIYAIPPASPLHYVTYVDVYGATANDVYVGYTPGYLGSVVAPDGAVVYGTGYDYQPWVGTEWYPPPATYGLAAEPVYNPAVGWAFGTALGLTTAAMVNSWDNNNHNDYYAPYYHGYPCCGSTSAQVYGHYADTYTSGNEKWYSNSNGNVGRSYSGSYTDYRTGTTGNVSASQNFNEQTGETTDKANRSFDTAEGTTGNVHRSESYDPQTGTTSTSGSATATNREGDSESAKRTTSYDAQTGQSKYDASRTASGVGGSSVTRETSGETGDGQSQISRETTTYNARTGQTNTYDRGEDDGQRYAGADGNVYRNSGRLAATYLGRLAECLLGHVLGRPGAAGPQRRFRPVQRLRRRGLGPVRRWRSGRRLRRRSLGRRRWLRAVRRRRLRGRQIRRMAAMSLGAIELTPSDRHWVGGKRCSQRRRERAGSPWMNPVRGSPGRAG